MCCCTSHHGAARGHHGMQGHACGCENASPQGELGRLRQVLQSIKKEVGAVEARIATLETEQQGDR